MAPADAPLAAPTEATSVVPGTDPSTSFPEFRLAAVGALILRSGIGWCCVPERSGCFASKLFADRRVGCDTEKAGSTTLSMETEETGKTAGDNGDA